MGLQIVTSMTLLTLRLAAVSVAIAAGAACGGGGAVPTSPTPTTSTSEPGAATSTTPTTPPVTTTFGGWDFNGQVWRPIGTPPSCANPLILPLPVDMSRVTSILYPGQVRGDYKAHGGFRFDMPGQTTAIDVRATMAGRLLRASRYLASGEIQYTFDFVNDCGIMFRFGHLRDLAPKYQAIADTLPAPVELDSRSTGISGVTVTLGELIGTGTGLRDAARNVFLDYGVYDLRQRNPSSADPAWLAAHDNDTMPYGTCWFDTLSAADAARVRSLPPADAVMGRTSDYCR